MRSVGIEGITDTIRYLVIAINCEGIPCLGSSKRQGHGQPLALGMFETTQQVFTQQWLLSVSQSEVRNQIAALPPLQDLLRAYPEWRVLIRIASDSGIPFWREIFCPLYPFTLATSSMIFSTYIFVGARESCAESVGFQPGHSREHLAAACTGRQLSTIRLGVDSVDIPAGLVSVPHLQVVSHR